MTRHFCRAFVFALLAVAGLASPARAADILPDPHGFVTAAVTNTCCADNSPVRIFSGDEDASPAGKDTDDRRQDAEAGQAAAG